MKAKDLLLPFVLAKRKTKKIIFHWLCENILLGIPQTDKLLLLKGSTTSIKLS